MSLLTPTDYAILGPYAGFLFGYGAMFALSHVKHWLLSRSSRAHISKALTVERYGNA
jgi:hypothetical protein